MGAYICDLCDGMFCSHEVNYYCCEKCEKAFCEGCWIERLHEDQEITETGICGNCFEQAIAEAKEQT